MEVRLPVIDRPKQKTRSHVLIDHGGPAFVGPVSGVPSYHCGGCGQVLVTGVHAKQFLDGSRPIESAGATINRPVALDPGDYRITAAIDVKSEKSVLLSYNGPAVLSCPCGASNEMIVPNQLFDESED